MNPNVAILSAAVGVLAIVLSIFGASWLNQRAMERMIDQMEKRMDARFNAIDQRFSFIEQRLDRIERQLEAIFKPILPKP